METADFSLQLLLNMLKEITDGEVNSKSLHLLLLLNADGSTAKRLFNGTTAWPRRWKKSAYKIDAEYKKEFSEVREAVLRGRPLEHLNAAEKARLQEEEKAFMEDLYSAYGIHKLRVCCYAPGKDKVLSFKDRLTNLVETVLTTAEEYWNVSGRAVVLSHLRTRGLEDLIARLDAMDEDDYPGMARFLVQCAAPDEERPKEKASSDGVRLLRYEDLIKLGLTAWDIAQNLVENDYEVYPDIAPENEADASLWKEYLSRYPDTFAYLVDQDMRIVGNWSFVSITEEQERLMEAGELIEGTFNVQNTECLFLPGDYTLYLLNLSCNEGFAKPQYYQALIDELWKQMLAYAKDGIYFKRFCINVFHPVYEALWRSMGFQPVVKNRFSGHIYAQSLVPFPSTLKAKDPAIFLELKKRYDEHFAV